MLSSLLLSILRERYPDRGLVEGRPPDPVARFPGVHPGIRGASIYDDGSEFTLVIEDVTHGHFGEYAEGLSDAEHARRVVGQVVEFLDDLFADRVVVWGRADTCGGWYTLGTSADSLPRGSPAFVWSGPVTPRRSGRSRRRPPPAPGSGPPARSRRPKGPGPGRRPTGT